MYYRQIRRTVSVQIAGRDGFGPIADRISHGRGKRAVALVEQYRNRAVIQVGIRDYQVKVGIAVEVSERHAARRAADRVVHWRTEDTPALIQHD